MKTPPCCHLERSEKLHKVNFWQSRKTATAVTPALTNSRLARHNPSVDLVR